MCAITFRQPTDMTTIPQRYTGQTDGRTDGLTDIM